MTKICTSIEQSKKLTELGLDVNTADMVILHEEPYETSDSKFDGLHEVLCVPFKKYDTGYKKKYKNISYFPAWSLSALVKLMPNATLMMKDHESGKDFSYCFCIAKHKEFVSDSPLDAAFEMVCWLLESDKI